MHGEAKKRDLSILDWMGIQLLLVIPVVNLIPLIIWAIGSKIPSKRHYAIAYLIWTVIVCLLVALALVFFRGPILVWLQNMLEQKPVVS